MDYFDVLKKAWNITWRYKALWVLGLFVGGTAGGMGGGSGSSYSGDSSGGTYGDLGSYGDSTFDYRAIASWSAEHVVLIALGLFLLVVILLTWFVLSVASQGGLVHGANEAAGDTRPSLRRAWAVGFHRWGRTFMTTLVLMVPAMLVLGFMVGLSMLAFALGAESGDAGVGGVFCCALPALLAAFAFVAVVTDITFQLALRYGVLFDVSFGKAIKRGWEDLLGKKGAFVFWLVMLLPGIAYSFVLVALAVVFMVPLFLAVSAGQTLVAAALAVLFFLLLLLPVAIYGAFSSSAWTVFFRRMTGVEPLAVPAPAYAQVIHPPIPPAPPVYPPAPLNSPDLPTDPFPPPAPSAPASPPDA